MKNHISPKPWKVIMSYYSRQNEKYSCLGICFLQDWVTNGCFWDIVNALLISNQQIAALDFNSRESYSGVLCNVKYTQSFQKMILKMKTEHIQIEDSLSILS